MAADAAGGAAGLATMTVAISSHQRRAPLERLLRSLARELDGRPALQAGLDVVVVLDGSTDGSAELLESLRFPVPLRTIRQPHRGLAAARNAGLAAATGELVWFLDDDLVAVDGVVGRHRRVDDPGDRRFLVGPCALPPDAAVHPLVRAFWEDRHRELSRAGRVERFDQFSAANTSGPVAALRRVGGFDEGFVGYGAEDYELAVRLLADGASIRYDPEAVTWHRPPHGVVEICTRLRSEGRNQVRLVTAHPETFDTVFPRRPWLPWPERAIRALSLHRHPWLLDVLSTVLLPLVRLEARLSGQRSTHVLGLASAARFVASVVRHDPDGRIIDRVLGADEP